MSGSWKISAYAERQIVEAALLAQEANMEWNPDIVIAGSETAPETPQEWVLEAWFQHQPSPQDTNSIAALFTGDLPALCIEELPDADWVTLSQQGAKPIVAGRFYIHTPDYPAADDPALSSIVIPASQAFGTGQHETTSGCVTILDIMKSRGVAARNIADIGTGTGLLALAALDLWPGAYATASDIDPVCAENVVYNCAHNGRKMGADKGEIMMVVADGMADPLLEARGPYDLLIANILAAPLIAMAQDFAHNITPGGHVVLAGLLNTQEQAVRRAYTRAGFRLETRLTHGDWAILWLRKTRSV